MRYILQELLDEAGREQYSANVGELAVNRIKNRNPQIVPCKLGEGKEERERERERGRERARERERFIL